MIEDFAEVLIGRDDLKMLYGLDVGVTEGCFVWIEDLRICRDGVYMRDPDPRPGETDAVGLSDAERSALRPIADYTQPLFTLPCKLGELQGHIDTHNLPDPDCFRLIDWLGTRPKPSKPAAQAVTATTAPGVSVMLPHLNTSLEKVFKVMWEQWGDYHPQRPPKQGNVAHDLDEVMGWNTQRDGSASRKATAIASILKPDVAVSE